MGKLVAITIQKQYDSRFIVPMKDKIISHFLLSEYKRKHDPVSGNAEQRTLLTLARLWH